MVLALSRPGVAYKRVWAWAIPTQHLPFPAYVCEGLRAPQAALVVKNPPANAGDKRDASLIHGSGRSPRGGHGKPLQYSCLGNPMDRGATVHRVAKSQTWLRQLSMSAAK